MKRSTIELSWTAEKPTEPIFDEKKRKHLHILNSKIHLSIKYFNVNQNSAIVGIGFNCSSMMTYQGKLVAE